MGQSACYLGKGKGGCLSGRSQAKGLLSFKGMERGVDGGDRLGDTGVQLYGRRVRERVLPGLGTAGLEALAGGEARRRCGNRAGWRRRGEL